MNKQKTLDELPKMTEVQRKELAEGEQELNGDFQAQMKKDVAFLKPEIQDILAKNGGRCNKLDSDQRAEYIKYLCAKIGIDPTFRPIDLIETQGAVKPYLNKGWAEQIRDVRKISILNTEVKEQNPIWIVTCKGRSELTGRIDMEIGSKLIGNEPHNSLMKAMTAAKRRLTLSMCGLGAIIEEAHPSEYNGNGKPEQSESRTNVLIKNLTEMKQIFHDVVMSKVDVEKLPEKIWRMIISQSMRLADTTEYDEAARWLQEHGTIVLKKDDNGNVIKATIKEVKNGSAKG